MDLGRISGVLLHPTSLPSPYGIGELGSEARRFADFLTETEQSLWQVLPIGPTGYGDSPYQSFSSHAGNPLLISIEQLIVDGWLTAADLEGMPAFPEGEVDFGPLIEWKFGILRKAFQRFREAASDRQKQLYKTYVNRQGAWLEDFALFMALKEEHDLVPWHEWEPELVKRVPEALAACRLRLADAVDAHRFWQYLFHEQWSALKQYCNERGVRIMGDIPIYTAHDSADVWANPELFHLDEKGRATLVAGVPPDYFSATGQYWGNPIYRWDVLAETGYEWWVDRMRSLLGKLDVIRIDHFRGFEAYWEIPASEETAVNGRWVTGPGRRLFDALEEALGELPIVAENLGIITAEVEALRESLGFPGMGVLQFAFGTDRNSPGILPHSYPRDTVAYTGTHDNDTTVGWWNSSGQGTTRSLEELQAERRFARKYLGVCGHGIQWDCLRGIHASAADISIVPLQDVLGLGADARMNQPGTLGGNWRWRFRAGAITEEHARLLREMTVLYGRSPRKVPVDAL